MACSTTVSINVSKIKRAIKILNENIDNIDNMIAALSASEDDEMNEIVDGNIKDSLQDLRELRSYFTDLVGA